MNTTINIRVRRWVKPYMLVRAVLLCRINVSREGVHIELDSERATDSWLIRRFGIVVT